MISRREALAALAGASIAAASDRLGAIVGDIPGAALLLAVPTPKLLAVHAPNVAGTMLVPPGSAIKPFALEALLQAGKLRADEAFPCPGNLEIEGRSLPCSHPPVATPMQVRTALAYSCNCFVAHLANRFAPGELAAHLTRAGLTSTSGLLGDREANGRLAPANPALQAIGEDGVLVTTAAMAMAYRRLARNSSDPIRAGLEGAVEFGTAQQAAVPGTKVAGKTGSVRAADGSHIAWFCGFAPSRAPSVVVAVMLQGRSGGADAAPVAARIFAAHQAGRI